VRKSPLASSERTGNCSGTNDSVWAPNRWELPSGELTLSDHVIYDLTALIHRIRVLGGSASIFPPICTAHNLNARIGRGKPFSRTRLLSSFIKLRRRYIPLLVAEAHHEAEVKIAALGERRQRDVERETPAGYADAVEVATVECVIGLETLAFVRVNLSESISEAKNHNEANQQMA
jgi:hypothetical protein